MLRAGREPVYHKESRSSTGTFHPCASEVYVVYRPLDDQGEPLPRARALRVLGWVSSPGDDVSVRGLVSSCSRYPSTSLMDVEWYLDGVSWGEGIQEVQGYVDRAGVVSLAQSGVEVVWGHEPRRAS